VVTFLTYLLGLLVVGGVLFLLASFAFGRGEELAPMPPDGTPVELPDGRFGGAAVRRLRMSVVLRGYRMDEVDWVLDVLADQLDTRDAEIARLRRLATAAAHPAGRDEEPATPEPAGAEPAGVSPAAESVPAAAETPPAGAEPAPAAAEPAPAAAEPATAAEPVTARAEPATARAEPAPAAAGRPRAAGSDEAGDG
jgi:DivIVA domain-containing protein